MLFHIAVKLVKLESESAFYQSIQVVETVISSKEASHGG